MAKEKKLKVPKRIAGVKVPKKVRKTANKALALADNPVAMDLAAAALTAAAAALSESKAGAGKRRPRRPGEGGTDDRAGKLADLIIAAALDGARRLLDGAEKPADAEAADAADATVGEKPKQRRPSGRRGPSAQPADA